MKAKQTTRAAISFRVDTSRLGLIDQAANVTGENRTEFMMDASTRKAEAVLLDQKLFMADEEAWDEFEAALNAPPEPNERLQRLMKTIPRWGNGKSRKN